MRVIHGDCAEVLPRLAAEGLLVHAAVTDPPYHLTGTVKRFAKTPRTLATVGKHAYGRHVAGFMGQMWDGGDVAFRPETWTAVRACMRPGAFLVAFASTRGYHRMACAIEDAGFIIHPMLGWIFGSGFPKATRFEQPELEGWRYGLQALKPAIEPICLAQVPMDGTGSQNWAKHGCGGLNIDACRVPGTVTAADARRTPSNRQVGSARVYGGGFRGESTNTNPHPDSARHNALGRWPANLIHDGSDEVLDAFAAFGERKGGAWPAARGTGGIGTAGHGGQTGLTPRRADDFGTVARFFYCTKADARDRAGSKHPAVKPQALMSWLVRLVCPPGGTILDPFAGTGSTGLAADRLGMNAVLIEQDAEYVADARRKLAADAGLFAETAP